jgi:hypothetical protein
LPDFLFSQHRTCEAGRRSSTPRAVPEMSVAIAHRARVTG